MMAVVCLPLYAAAEEEYEILNPYESVDWAKAKPYRTQLHTHTTASDGKQTMAEALENYYSHGYDFVAVTDHGVVDRSWTRPTHTPVFGIPEKNWTGPIYNFLNGLIGSQKIQGLTEARLREITEGADRDGRGMLRVPFGIELNPNGHSVELNSWFSDWGNFQFMPGGDYEYSFPAKQVQKAGGLAMVNHPSGSSFNGGLSFDEIYEGENYGYVNKIQVLLEKYSSLLGIELARNAKDFKLWDTLLANLAPSGRNVFGFTTSDSHAADTVGDGWIWALMEEQTVGNLRGSLEAGAFFSAVKADAAKAEPMITEIAVNSGSITITAKNHEGIRWISDGKVAATGSELLLDGLIGELGAYVRAEVWGEGGILYTQPFLLSYEGMPAGRPVPCDYVDEGRNIVVIRTLLCPFLWVLDGIWKVIQCW
jgi:histidinol phosphatase-like PHP family hydrolase